MKIKKVVCSAGKTGFFFDDQKAIKAGAKNDGNFYVGEPMTPGFTSVRQMGESISVMFIAFFLFNSLTYSFLIYIISPPLKKKGKISLFIRT